MSVRLRGAVAGVLAGGAALGAGQLATAAIRPVASPVVAIGTALIDAAPEPVRAFAIRNFGVDDKTVLVSSVLAMFAVVAAAAGVLALRRALAGAIAVLVLASAGVVAAGSNTGARPADVVPSVVAGIVGTLVLGLLRGRARAMTPEPATDTSPPARSSYDRRGFLLTGVATAVGAATAGAAGRMLQGARFDAARSRAAVRLPEPVRTVARPPTASAAPGARPTPGIGRDPTASPSSRPATPPPADASPGIGPAPSRAPSAFKVNGLSSFNTPNSGFYRVDTAILVPQLSTRDWSLRIHGMVTSARTISYAELSKRALIERDVTLCCVSNPVGGPYISTARFLGAPLSELLAEVGVLPGAEQILTRSSDGWTCGTPTALVLDGRDAMLAIGMNGVPLPLEHGFPVRMVVPGLYGYTSGTKWIVDMELTTFGAYDPYWIKRGWSPPGPIRTESRIDTPRSAAGPLAPGAIPVAGVAWAQHRGISRVEVRVDGGRWNRARLGPVASKDTWRQWVWTWQAAPGEHVLQVRATDGTGATQVSTATDPFPSGATGWHSVPVTVQI